VETILSLNKNKLIFNKIVKYSGLVFCGIIVFCLVTCFYFFTKNVALAASSDCHHISGSGPIGVVFLKDENLSLATDFPTLIAQSISGFKTIDPFKTYFDRFSFYFYSVGRNLSASNAGSTGRKLNIEDGVEVATFIQEAMASGCAGTTLANTQFVYFSNAVDRSWTMTDLAPKFLFISSIINGKATSGNVVIHESGHAWGRLSDEYIEGDRSPIEGYSLNCSRNPEVDFINSEDGKKYGNTNIVGCNYTSFGSYRPSQNSIMNNTSFELMSATLDRDAGTKFNVVSCGYLVAGILGETVNKNNAQTHWADCCNMDVIEDGITGCGNSEPIIFESKENMRYEDIWSNVISIDYNQDTCVSQDYEYTIGGEEMIKISATSDIPLGELENSIEIEESSRSLDGSILIGIVTYNVNYFNINGTDVSVDDGNGGRKIPKGDLISFPVGTPIIYSTGVKSGTGGLDFPLVKTYYSSPFVQVFGSGVNTKSCFILTNINFPSPSKNSYCSPDSFVNFTFQAAPKYELVILAKEDIPLRTINTINGSIIANFFNINGTDVSVDDGNGGRKIPKGDLIKIPAGTIDIGYETGDNYCRDDELVFYLNQKPTNLQRPFSCFFICN